MTSADAEHLSCREFVEVRGTHRTVLGVAWPVAVARAPRRRAGSRSRLALQPR
jgi:hypothetical protein